MNVRERMEQEEYEFLSPQAQKAAETKGRPEPEDDNDVRTCYQRDADRILHSKSFRRLMHKTQVFLSPEGDHYRTRMTHTLEVARIARTICRGLRLNQDLAEAAAYGHDLGHTPFGHAGEKALSSMLDKPFRHNEQSLRVVDKLERDGAGLNLTYEVRMGILGHTGDFIPETLEGQIVRTSDRIAYINHDIDDAMRAGILTEADIPAQIAEILGHSHSQRINTLVENMIENTIFALGFIVSFLAEIFGQFQKIKAVINAGLHLRQVEEVFFNVCAGEGVAVTALVDLKLAEDERIGDGHQRAFHAAGAAREGGDFAELPGQDHDALVILSDRGGG